MTDFSSNSLPESSVDQAGKIQSLREMILNAEKTIQGAKAMLLQLEGKKKTGRPKKIEDPTEGTIVEGTFDGQIMIGTDGRQYPVPANYASKSKLVEGDMLKLTITPDGSFIYKQIGPIDRRHAIGIVSQDESGNYHVLVNGTPYRVLLASITYFRAEPGDEVAVVMPREIETSWVAIENILRKGALFESSAETPRTAHPTGASMPSRPSKIDDWKDDLGIPKDVSTETINTQEESPLDTWVRDMEKFEEEMKTEHKS